MKHLLLFGCILFIQIAGAQNPVLNNSFESWSLGEPDNWLTNNMLSSVPLLTQENGGYTGVSAIKGEVVMNAGTVLAPVLYSAPSGTQSGFPMTVPYSTLEFYYKFSPAIAGDALYAYINVQNVNGNGIANGIQMLGNPTSVFTLGTAPINYIGPDPTNLELSFSIINAGGPNIGVGSWFILDELSMTNATAVHEISQNQLKQPYPNPAAEYLNIPFQIVNPGEISIQIYDMQGRMVNEVLTTASVVTDGKAIADVNRLSSGVYRCVMSDNQTKSSVLFGVNR